MALPLGHDALEVQALHCLEQLAPMLVDPRDRALARIAGPLTTTDHHSRLIVRGQ